MSRLRNRAALRRTAFPDQSTIESLESRLLLSNVTGYQWSNTNVSVSLLPDGTTTWNDDRSQLFAELDSVASRNVWQQEFARALQSWANETNLNFHFVTDDGSPSGTSGSAQGDSRFGDIRLGTEQLPGYVGYAYYPHDSHTLGGDIYLDPDYTFHIDEHIDLYSVLLHETGHALGLDHSASGTVMYSTITGVYSGLTDDDIQGIQSIYGTRQPDTFDASRPNDELATATELMLEDNGAGRYQADLTSATDADYYQFKAPSNSDGTAQISVDARNLSLLSPRLTVFNASGQIIDMASAAEAYEGVAHVSITGVNAGELFYVAADGDANSVFGMGGYWLNAQFGVTTNTTDSESPLPQEPTVTADHHESNDSFSTATALGRTNGTSESGLSLHTTTDADYFDFIIHKGGTFDIVARTLSGERGTQVTVYDVHHSTLATGPEAVRLSLTGGQQYFASVTGINEYHGQYDFSLAKIEPAGGDKGNSGKGGGKGGKEGGGVAIGHGSTVGEPDQGHGEHADPRSGEHHVLTAEPVSDTAPVVWRTLIVDGQSEISLLSVLLAGGSGPTERVPTLVSDGRDDTVLLPCGINHSASLLDENFPERVTDHIDEVFDENGLPPLMHELWGNQANG